MISYLSLADILSRIEHFTADTQLYRDAVMRTWINSELEYVGGLIDWPELTAKTEVTSQNGEDLHLPYDCSILMDVRRKIDMSEIIIVSPQAAMDRYGLAYGVGSAPVCMVPNGAWGQSLFLPVASTIRVNSQGDAVSVKIRGKVGGVSAEEVAAFTGIHDFTNVYDAGLSIEMVSTSSTALVGSALPRTKPLIVQSMPGSVEICRIPSWHSTTKYRWYRLQPASGVGVEDYVMTYRRMPRPLYDPDDVPDIPVSIYLVEAGIAASWRMQRKWQPASDHEARAHQILDTIIARMVANEPRLMQIRPAWGWRPRYRGLSVSP